MNRPVDQHFEVRAVASDWNWSVGQGSMRLHVHQSSEGEWYWTGDFVDPRGIVTIYRQSDITRIDFAHAGRCYSRNWNEYFGDRTIARLARAFVTEIAGPLPTPPAKGEGRRP